MIGVLLSVRSGAPGGARRRGGSRRRCATWAPQRTADELVGAATASSPRSAPGEIAGLAAELEATRERLASAQQRARALEDSRRELVAFLSHDLRTPLAGLRALAEGLEDGVVGDPGMALHQMRQTVDRMTGLVGDLFELSRLSSSPEPRRGSGPWSASSSSRMTWPASSTSTPDAGTSGFCWTCPPDDDRLAIRGDGDELSRALDQPGRQRGSPHRLPAARSSYRRPAPRTAEIKARRDRRLRRHSGGRPGARVRRRLASHVRRVARTDGGAGLGLAIAKGVIEAHAGGISVENVPGGCRFAVSLPRDAVADPA